MIIQFIFSVELKSVYVRNLPSTISAADIEQEFKTFGRIMPDGVFIRNRKVSFYSMPFQSFAFMYIWSLEGSPFNHLLLCIYGFWKEAKIAIDVQDVGVCYAFVEFEDLQAVQNAIKVWIFVMFAINH